MKSRVLSFLSLVVVIAALVCCESGGEHKPLTIRDTVNFHVDFTASGAPYSFNFKPGDNHYSDASQTYGNSGWTRYNSAAELMSVGSYLMISDVSKNVDMKIGFYFTPSRVIRGFGEDDRCGLLQEDSDKYFTTGTYSFCDSWGGFDEFPECAIASQDQFYFEIELDTMNEMFVSSKPTAESYFRIDKFSKLLYVDEKTSEANFNWVIEGAFSVNLLSYDGRHPNATPDTLKIENGAFKIGVRDLCL